MYNILALGLERRYELRHALPRFGVVHVGAEQLALLFRKHVVTDMFLLRRRRIINQQTVQILRTVEIDLEQATAITVFWSRT